MLFSSEEVLIEHKENCLIINGKQSVKLKSDSISFKNYFKQLPFPFKIYADFECLFLNVFFDKLFVVGDDKVRDHCLITGKYRGAAHWGCNISLKLTKKIILHNLRGYDSHLIIKEISKFDVKVSVIPNGLEKYMGLTINRNSVFIDSMQFMNSSLDSLVKNLSNDDFKYLSEEFSG